MIIVQYNISTIIVINFIMLVFAANVFSSEDLAVAYVAVAEALCQPPRLAATASAASLPAERDRERER